MLWIELTTPAGQKTWENLSTYQSMRPSDLKGEPVTHLVSLGRDKEDQPIIVTVRETPEEILKLAGMSRKPGVTPTGVGFIRRAADDLTG